MILVFGGACHGKRAYVKEKYGASDFYECMWETPALAFDKPVIAGLEKFIYACVQAETDPKAYLRQHLDALCDKIVICEDVTCGVVPLGAQNRLWRDETGRCMAMLAAQCERVTRIFCGLEEVLK